MAGVSRKVTSVCHQLARSTLPSMASTSALSAMAGSTGWASVTSPNWRPKSACCSRREGLVTEEDHVMRVQGLAHRGDHLRRQRHRQVDVLDLRPDGGRERVHAGGRWRGSQGELCLRSRASSIAAAPEGPYIGR